MPRLECPESDLTLFRAIDEYNTFLAKAQAGDAVSGLDARVLNARLDQLADHATAAAARVNEARLGRFATAYFCGLGAGSLQERAASRFHHGVLDVKVATTTDALVDAVLAGLYRLLDAYRIPLLVRVHDEPGTHALVAQGCTPDGLYHGDDALRLSNLTTRLTAYVTEIRGGSGEETQPSGKNREEYYGCTNGGVTVFLLGGQKDLSSEAVARAATHEFIHLALPGVPHHEIHWKGRNDTPYFDPDAPCVLHGNGYKERRGPDPCGFLDYQLRLAVQGFNDRRTADARHS